ncbi:MAG: aminopeptidase N [Paraperlucidibaca sp.]
MTEKTIYLKDYQAPHYALEHTELRFELFSDYTDVSAELRFRRAVSAPKDAVLTLLGADLELRSVAWNDQPLSATDWQWQEEKWQFAGAGEGGVLSTRVRIYPDQNLALEGLYRSHGLYCTQCEAEGFRKITLYPDRPDVLSTFRTTIIADKASCPIMLSNGNCVASGDADDGRHWATWEDPHPKPSYLFALVAGDLACLRDSFTTVSGRVVALEIYTDEADQDKCEHAMRSLQAAMRWDEERYGCEYDLDRYMIVAVSHFNMGAMENKGLNVFNTSCVLAHPATTTDAGFQRVESVVAHEYFHNWSGNRVTCRDWFQLCLKEGFTVFRDQQFSADQLSAAVQRLEDVAFLQTHQFAEDAGPLSHAVRPESFVEINNFYTLTVYEKGAEIARMLHTFLGADSFRRGSDHYFKTFDGQAATVEDFLGSMAAANDIAVETFVAQWLRWYRQPGTPVVSVRSAWHQAKQQLTLTLTQTQPARAGSVPEALPIPVRLGFIGLKGELSTAWQGVQANEHLLMLEQAEQTWQFDGVAEMPVLSLFRDFSAPVRVQAELSDADLAQLIRLDSNSFNRWSASYALATREILVRAEQYRRGDLRARQPQASTLAAAMAEMWPSLATQDPALAAKMLQLPSLAYLSDQVSCFDPASLQRARDSLLMQVLTPLQGTLEALLAQQQMLMPYAYTAQAMAARSLAALALDGLAHVQPASAAAIAQRWLNAAPHMSAEQAALTTLVHHQLPGADAALQAFYARWKHEPLVLDQWFATQTSAPHAETRAIVEALLAHADFDASVPNRVRAVIGQFANNNPVAFHDSEGRGYRLLAVQLLAIDARNPQLASRLGGAFGIWHKLDESRQALVLRELDALLAGELSSDTRETLTRIRAAKD